MLLPRFLQMFGNFLLLSSHHDIRSCFFIAALLHRDIDLHELLPRNSTGIFANKLEMFNYSK